MTLPAFPRWAAPALVAVVLLMGLGWWTHVQRERGRADAYAKEVERSEIVVEALISQLDAADERARTDSIRLDSVQAAVRPQAEEARTRGDSIVREIVEVVPERHVEMRAELEHLVALREEEIRRERRLWDAEREALESQVASLRAQVSAGERLEAGLRETIRLQASQIDALEGASGAGLMDRAKWAGIGAAVGFVGGVVLR